MSDPTDERQPKSQAATARSDGSRSTKEQIGEPPIVEPPAIVNASLVQPYPTQNAISDDSEKRSFSSTVMRSQIAVLCILFFVTAGLGIPLLWRSPAFSHKERIVWTIIITIYTSIIFWIFYEIMAWSWSQISTLF